MSRNIKRGFTLVEILIVVIILGILAAIVIPQFSNASRDARRPNVTSRRQTLRSQIELFKLQHRDKLPGGDSNGAFTSAEFWAKSRTPANAQSQSTRCGRLPVHAAKGRREQVQWNGRGRRCPQPTRQGPSLGDLQ